MASILLRLPSVWTISRAAISALPKGAGLAVRAAVLPPRGVMSMCGVAVRAVNLSTRAAFEIGRALSKDAVASAVGRSARTSFTSDLLSQAVLSAVKRVIPTAKKVNDLTGGVFTKHFPLTCARITSLLRAADRGHSPVSHVSMTLSSDLAPADLDSSMHHSTHENLTETVLPVQKERAIGLMNDNQAALERHSNDDEVLTGMIEAVVEHPLPAVVIPALGAIVTVDHHQTALQIQAGSFAVSEENSEQEQVNNLTRGGMFRTMPHSDRADAQNLSFDGPPEDGFIKYSDKLERSIEGQITKFVYKGLAGAVLPRTGDVVDIRDKGQNNVTNFDLAVGAASVDKIREETPKEQLALTILANTACEVQQLTEICEHEKVLCSTKKNVLDLNPEGSYMAQPPQQTLKKKLLGATSTNTVSEPNQGRFPKSINPNKTFEDKQVKPAQAALGMHIHSNDEVTNDQIQAVLKPHSRTDLIPALGAVGNIVTGDYHQTQKLCEEKSVLPPAFLCNEGERYAFLVVHNNKKKWKVTGTVRNLKTSQDLTNMEILALEDQNLILENGAYVAVDFSHKEDDSYFLEEGHDGRAQVQSSRADAAGLDGRAQVRAHEHGTGLQKSDQVGSAIMTDDPGPVEVRASAGRKHKKKRRGKRAK